MVGNRVSSGVIHRRRYVRRKPVPRRPSMLDPYIPIMEEWLAVAPHLSAVDLLSRLCKRMRPVGSAAISGVRCSDW
ncbi:hypothetical protein ACVII1_004365 [Bradyrhizobium elkanii]